MDLYCQVCGEPYDILSVESYGFSQEEREKFHNGVGCPACDFGKKVKDSVPFRAQLSAALSDVLGDVLGDDIDGVASMMDDAECLFGEAFYD